MASMAKVRTLNRRPQKTSGPVVYWMQHPVFGSIRSMTLSGAYRTFDVDRYIAEPSVPGQC